MLGKKKEDEIKNESTILNNDVNANSSQPVSNEGINQDSNEVELNKLKSTITELENKLKYQQAELINYRKRKDEETANMLKFANQDLILELIQIVDNFERAIKLDDNNLDDGIFSKDKYNVNYYAQLLMQYAIEKSNVSVDDGIDNYFIELAKKEGKTFLEIESIESQEEVLASISDKIYENMILGVIDNLDDSIKEAEDSFAQWKKGDEEEIWKDDGSSVKKGDEDII